MRPSWLLRRVGVARLAAGAVIVGMVCSTLLSLSTKDALVVQVLAIVGGGAGALATRRSRQNGGERQAAGGPRSVWHECASARCSIDRVSAGYVRADLRPLGACSAVRPEAGAPAEHAPSGATPGPASRPRECLAVTAILLVCLASGLFLGAWRAQTQTGWARSLPGGGVRIEGRAVVIGAARERGALLEVPARVTAAQVGWIPGGPPPPVEGQKVLLGLSSERAEAAPPDEGTILRFSGRLGAAAETGAGSPRENRRRLYAKGLSAGIAVRGDVESLGRRGGPTGALDALRRGARAHLSTGLPARYAGLLRGVILGEKGGIEERDREAFRASGTAHILSVSGLHVATLASLVLLAGSLLGLARGPTYLMAGALAVVFVPLTGAAAPVVRAAIVFVLFLAGQTAGARRDQAQLLMLAAIAALLYNPFFIWDAGFRLSFSAAAGLLLLTRRVQSALEFLPGPLAPGVAVSIAATVGTAPISLYTFGQVSLAGVVANILVVPPLAPIMALGLGSIIIGFASEQAAGSLNWVSAVLLSWIVQTAHVFGRLPLLRPEGLYEAACAAGGVLFGAAAAAAVLGRPPLLPTRLPPLSLLDGLGRRFSPSSRARRRLVAVALPPLLGVVLLAGGSAAAGAAAELRLLVSARNWPASVEIRVLDVGQGTSVIVRTPGGGALLFDAGPRSAGLADQLRALGIRRLDLVVLSHPHEDHFGGLGEVLDSMDVEAFVEAPSASAKSPPPTEESSSAARPPAPERPRAPPSPEAGSFEEREAGWYTDLQERLAQMGARAIPIVERAELELDGVRVELWAPPAAPGSGRTKDPNSAGVVAMVRVGGAVILLPGDAEADALRRYDPPPVDILVVPHHGSRGAVDSRLLRRLGPRVAVVPVGRDNRFGHPHAEVMADLRQAGVLTLRTDETGWVALLPGSRGIEIRSGRSAVAVFETVPGNLHDAGAADAR